MVFRRNKNAAGNGRGFDSSTEDENGMGFGVRHRAGLPVADDKHIDDGHIGATDAHDFTQADESHGAERAGKPIREPLARRLVRVCDAVDLLIPELEHQVQQLTQRAESSTESEARHIRDIARGYSESARYLKMLKRYQSSRLRRMRVQ